MFPLTTERLLIKAPTLADFEGPCSLHSDPDVMQYLDGPCTPYTVQKWLERNIAHQNKHGFCIGSVFAKDTHQFVGRAGIIYLDHDDAQPDIEIGYVLHKTYWGQNHATELAKALVKWGFANLNIDRLVAVTHPENKKSQRVLEKVGMRFVKQVQCHGQDNHLYEILRKGPEK